MKAHGNTTAHAGWAMTPTTPPRERGTFPHRRREVLCTPSASDPVFSSEEGSFVHNVCFAPRLLIGGEDKKNRPRRAGLSTASREE
jgi:hypothetical protein